MARESINATLRKAWAANPPAPATKTTLWHTFALMRGYPPASRWHREKYWPYIKAYWEKQHALQSDRPAGSLSPLPGICAEQGRLF